MEREKEKKKEEKGKDAKRVSASLKELKESIETKNGGEVTITMKQNPLFGNTKQNPN